MRCSNRKLLIVFEGSAQRERTIGCVTLRLSLMTAARTYWSSPVINSSMV